MDSSIPLRVWRKDISPYQDRQFTAWEKDNLESLNFNSKKFSIHYLEERSVVDADVVITTSQSKLTDLQFTPRLIIHPNSGYDNYTADFVSQAAYPIIVGNPIRSQAVANYILSSLFQHFANIPHHHSWDQNRVWPRDLLIEKNLLLLGYGHIGKILEKALKPLVKNLTIYDPWLNHNNIDLKEQNIIIPVASLNPSSKHIINHDFLRELPIDFLLINAARGGLVDQKALIKTLNRQPKAFACLDVFEKEPFDPEDFSEVSNIKTTSHIAGVYKSLDQAILSFEQSILKKFIENTENLAIFNSYYGHLLLQRRIKNGFLI